MNIYANVVQTPLGPLSVLVEEAGVCAMGFTPRPEELQARLGPSRRVAPLRQVADLGDVSAAIAAYFAGELAAIDALAVAQEGSTYQQRVWTALRAVPAGAPVSYRELAQRTGSSAAVRAAGTACGRNLVAPLVPCHRVVRTDGSLGGYYWGLERKRWLLAHERQHSRPLAMAAAGREALLL